MALRSPLAALAAVLLATVAAGAVPSPTPLSPPKNLDLTKMLTVLPPGQNGFASLDPATQDVVLGPHGLDQLDMYANLVYEDAITEAQTGDFFKNGGFNTVLDPANVERVEIVKPGVTVFRDTFGVPHVYGTTAEDVAYGAGYVTAEDRMFQADLFRRAGRGTLAELLGPAFIESDEVTRRDSYTEAELQTQIDNLSRRFGADGDRIARGLQTFSDGFNQRIAEAVANPALMPIEYPGTGNPPVPWRPTDTVAESVLLARQFGEAAGAEVRNAALLKALDSSLGSAEAPKAFEDLRFLNDPTAATTVPAEDGSFTYPTTGPVKPAAVAIPDHAADIYRGEISRAAKLGDLLGALASGGAAASNAMLIAPSESATGNGLQLGNPQVQYGVPQYLMEIALHGGGFNVSGMTFPGVSGFVLIGHGPDYAWTVTSGISDAVDVRAEKLCNPGGGPVAPDSDHYLYRGTCRKMEERTEVVAAKDSSPSTATNRADVSVLKVQRTVHGPVFARDTVGGVAVALVKQRAFWMRELDTAAGFAVFNFPSRVKSARDFAKGVNRLAVSLNLYYVDRDTIAYWHGGKYPVRASGVDTRLPTWGTGAWEWKGNIPFASQPHFTTGLNDPSAGRKYTYNWNNKPATGWANGDDTNWGEIQRVDSLQLLMDAKLAGTGTMNRIDVINVMNQVATADPRAPKLMPLLGGLTNAGADSRLPHALAVLSGWQGSDSLYHRIDRNKDGNYDDGAAIRLWDAWNRELVEGIFFDEIEGARSYLGFGVVDAPGPGGSAFFDGMFNHVLHVLDGTPSLTPQHDWLGGASRTSAVTSALVRALDSLGVASDADLDALVMPREEIVFSPLGGSSPLRIHWVNRGTWTHVAEITGRR